MEPADDAAASLARQSQVAEHADAVLAANAELEQRIDDKTLKVIADLVEYKKRAIFTKKLMGVVLAFVCLALGVEAYTINKVWANAATIRSQCESANEARKGLADIFRFIQESPSNTPLTPEQQKRRDDFFILVNKTTKQRDCSKPSTP